MDDDRCDQCGGIMAIADEGEGLLRVARWVAAHGDMDSREIEDLAKALLKRIDERRGSDPVD